MPIAFGDRTIKYESELDHNFADEIAERVGSKELHTCIQCGTCSGTCPVSLYMDYTPRRIVAMTLAGFKQEVLSSFTIWLCASCYSCTAECPKGIKITELMYALKQKAIEEKMYPKRFTIPTLAREFFKLVLKNGRNSEGKLITSVFLKTHPLNLLKMSRLGLRLLKTGRMNLKTERIQRMNELQPLLEALDENRNQSAGQGVRRA